MRCGVIAGNYFDDYPIIELSTLSNNTDGTLRAVTKLLGITVAEDKDESFSSKTDLLGVRGLICLILTWAKFVYATSSNKRKILRCRWTKSSTLDASIRCRYLRFFGRLQFAESQILGRAGGLALKTLRRLETMSCRSVNLDAEQKLMSSFLRHRLNHAKPRSITTTFGYPPVLVFTGVAYEPSDRYGHLVGKASIDGVIFVREGSHVTCRAFGCVLPQRVAEMWAKTGKKHLIGQTELYAVVLARKVWASYINNCRCIFFIDHAGVMSACIKGNAKDTSWRTLLLRMEEVDEPAPALVWFTRVPSSSNHCRWSFTWFV